MTATHAPSPRTEERAPVPAVRRERRRIWGTAGFHLSAGLLSALWLLPIALVLVTSLRSFDDVAAHGVGSLPHSFTLDGFRQAWVDGGQQRALINSLLVTVPAVLLSLLLASTAAFALSRYDVPLRRTLLLLMLGGNLLPPQILLVPVSKLSEMLGLYDTLYALIGVQVGFGIGFYVFVLHGFMRSIPPEIQQAAVIDGAGPWQIFTRIVLPLAKPAMAALSALSFTWIFNDLLWAITVLRTDSQMPITASLIGLQGQYVSMWNVIAAGSVIAAAPTVMVFLKFQRHFVAGLNLGAVK
ncbi:MULTISPECIES: carbohydrate ABC transporter permease [unclassified Streptomyces]|uniref:carbohydrate ABC transporter permease n=1 Tax=Streptomyces TaxID=1883 RepID=UPI0001C19D74|nr:MULTISPECIES: carbohydrate ABC transporter permease [unclassified Streptomyces]AEN13794.1 binding-protein-dependent transport systems inner membrane component [Streptomyces sp. SirexAA-E]MYT67683.1 ABC transporter permease subunit [Streptomyces sp. SID8357]MYT86527.1 ABC transporter permease subunit [Streptomyces sp. SID8360]MYU35609.1 ABC transporter permease subunit [Streptomyces sp. SID8358]MYW41243.1 ABC transporter permease subunit [Streptomyces sp. SID1]